MNLQFYAQFQLASARNLAMMLLLSTYGWFAPAVMGQTQISTWEDLHHIRDNLSSEYILVNDLNENTDGYNTYASELVNDGEGWLPIGRNSDNPFTGIFDGGGYVIQHLFINRNSHRIGLFGVVQNGEVKNVYLENINVTGDNYVGGLIGNNAGLVTSSYATSTIDGDGNSVGGLIGNNTGLVTSSYATSTVNGDGNSVGGLVGSNNGGNINSSYALGNVNGGGSGTGGLVGVNAIGGTVRTSYATGAVNGGGSYVGGLIGSGFGDVTDSFWNTETTGQDEPGEGIGLTTNEMQRPNPFLDANWDFWNDDDSGTNGAWGWNPDENDGYPFLRYQGFVDVTFPVVENKVPENDETGVEVNTVITLEFNQDVNEVDLDEVQITNADTGPVSGLAVTLDGNKLALEDAELIQPDVNILAP
ncbi:MAG: Ig-like domain-containing protein, partial [Balneolales bacterium]